MARTAYKRGGMRPWEVARQTREAAVAAAAETARRYGGGSAPPPAETTSAFVKVTLSPESFTLLTPTSKYRRP